MNKIILTEELLKNSLFVYQQYYFANTTFNEDEFETSQSFDQRMSEIIKFENNKHHIVTRKNLRRVVCILIAILLLFITTVGTLASKKTYAGFSVEEDPYNSAWYILNIPQGDKDSDPYTIEKAYEIGDLPDGYEQVSRLSYNIGERVIYSNGFFDMLFLQVPINIGSGCSIATYKTTLAEREYNGRKYFEYINKPLLMYDYYWVQDGYIMYLHAQSSRLDMLKICDSVRERK